MILLSIESGSAEGSVALHTNGELVAEREISEMANSQSLPVFIKDLSTLFPTEFAHLDGIVFSEGPGSYTGLRIGAGLVKSLCYVRQIPLFAVSTLCLLSHILLQKNIITKNEYTLLLPMIDARRMEVYTTPMNTHAETLSPITPLVIQNINSITSLLQSSNIQITNVKHFVYFGNGADKCTQILQNEQFIYVPNIYPKAKYLAPIVENGKENIHYKKFNNKDIAYYEPLYLKPYLPARSEVKGLR